MRGAAGGRDLLHDRFERHIGVIEGSDVGLAADLENRGEVRVTPQRGAQRERVHEHPDEAVELTLAATFHRCADHQIRAAPRPQQRDREKRVDTHEHGRVVPVGEFEQAGPRRGVDHCRQFRSALVPYGRARTVQGQIGELGDAGELCLPVGELTGRERLGVGAVPEDLVMPHRIVDVLDGQWRPFRGTTGQPGLVCLDEVRHERRHRPTVADDVMDDQHQHPFVVGDPDEPCPDRRFVLEIETARDDVGDRRGHPG
ncbi:hypothetical protein BPODLACK_03285 [Gordonia sp. YY1]|nr:hypothetical protein BPODLACK_03285 [Gordonia sp. YY1]